uniref:Uncharacterized protein n=2 Tax=Lotharella oceanica TaxID=641309 RepID=A0A7S2TSL8_9EUKA|mmetsp:Transcript_26206/g.48869  ORF Transcript_26206/g.48869 Transcript_26206/m.48869 type:complete len:339 (+) Transcript_26206:227-1243(+)
MSRRHRRRRRRRKNYKKSVSDPTSDFSHSSYSYTCSVSRSASRTSRASRSPKARRAASTVNPLVYGPRKSLEIIHNLDFKDLQGASSDTCTNRSRSVERTRHSIKFTGIPAGARSHPTSARNSRIHRKAFGVPAGSRRRSQVSFSRKSSISLKPPREEILTEVMRELNVDVCNQFPPTPPRISFISEYDRSSSYVWRKSPRYPKDTFIEAGDGHVLDAGKEYEEYVLQWAEDAKNATPRETKIETPAHNNTPAGTPTAFWKTQDDYDIKFRVSTPTQNSLARDAVSGTGDGHILDGLGDIWVDDEELEDTVSSIDRIIETNTTKANKLRRRLRKQKTV